MIRLAIPRAAALSLLGAALLSACADNGPTAPAAAPPPAVALTVIPTTAFTTNLDAGQAHTCALTSGGQAYCWGNNGVGQLGDSTASTRTTPVAVLQQAGVTFTQLSAGQIHNCALTSGGVAWCWGYNADYRLGDSTTSLGLAPVQVKGATGITWGSISAGAQHTCGLDTSGNAYCWGYNLYGQLGNNATAAQKTPVAVQMPGGVTFSAITAGEKHTCALDTTGQAWCWGYGAEGAMGGGFSFGDSIPVQVTHPGGVTFSSIHTEYRHTCALTSAGQAYCWGKNGSGQLGNNNTTTQYTPVAVQQPVGVTFAQIRTGYDNTCAVTSGGQAYCWGLNNNRGQVGDGTIWTTRRTPVAVAQPAGVSLGAVTVGSSFACGVDGVGQAWCWGRNDSSQLGDGGTTDSPTPVAVSH
jgi:alpha-tubulin suppressor-like RCC1 family protein